jgi:serine phosphatase RsbU (regulator of sigma subunit)
MDEFEINRLKSEISRLTEKTDNLSATIIFQESKIQDSINYASKIQRAMLPSVNILNNCQIENFILYKPKDIVSGDFYWFAHIQNKILVAVCDCTGHGVPGAFISVLGISFLNDIVIKDKITEADQILSHLRVKIISSLHQKSREHEIKDGMDISLIVIDIEKNILEFSGAYSPMYLVRKKDLTEIKGDRMSLAVHPNMHEFLIMSGDHQYMFHRDEWLVDHEAKYPFTKHEINLQKDDCIYIFSDGYHDQFGGEKGKKLQSARFKEILTMTSQYPMNKQKRLLDEYLSKWKGENEQVDDVLVVGVRV